MKKIVVIIIVLALGGLGYWYLNQQPEEVVNQNIKTYRNNTLGISFDYPTELQVSGGTESVALSHSIPFTNTGGCDMMGEEIVYERLTDFHVTFKVFNMGLVETMKAVSPYIPEENFVNNQVVTSPGFIDKYVIGQWNGYAIYEGAEGCGHTAYYFPISNSKTLLIIKVSIQPLSGVASSELEAEILKVPGVISRDKSTEIFEGILNTLKVN